MQRVLAALNAANPVAEVEPTPADPQSRKQAEIDRQKERAPENPQLTSRASRREPCSQPLWNVTTLCFVYPIFFPNGPDASEPIWRHLREEIERGKAKHENG